MSELETGSIDWAHEQVDALIQSFKEYGIETLALMHFSDPLSCESQTHHTRNMAQATSIGALQLTLNDLLHDALRD